MIIDFVRSRRRRRAHLMSLKKSERANERKKERKEKEKREKKKENKRTFLLFSSLCSFFSSFLLRVGRRSLKISLVQLNNNNNNNYFPLLRRPLVFSLSSTLFRLLLLLLRTIIIEMDADDGIEIRELQQVGAPRCC